MSLYSLFITMNKPKLDEFFKNAKLFRNQFTYEAFNEQCSNSMYENNSILDIKSVKLLKEELPLLKATCSECAAFFMIPRTKSIPGLDIQMGIFLENLLIDFLNGLGIRAIHADTSNKRHPDCMILSSDKGIIAYFELKYHAAPFILAKSKIGRYCYEGSATMDYKKLRTQLAIAYEDLDRPVYYLHWIDYPCLKGIFFETSDQVKESFEREHIEFSRQRREGDNDKGPKSVYLGKFYSPLLQMGTFEEFVKLVTEKGK